MGDFPHKRGDSFSASGQFEAPTSLVGWTGRAHLRETADGPLIDFLDFEWVDAASGRYLVTKINTSNWGYTDLFFDVEVRNPTTGQVESTLTHKIKIDKDFTHD